MSNMAFGRPQLIPTPFPRLMGRLCEEQGKIIQHGSTIVEHRRVFLLFVPLECLLSLALHFTFALHSGHSDGVRYYASKMKRICNKTP